MPCDVTIQDRHRRDADTVFAEAMQFGEMAQAMRGLARQDRLPRGAAQPGATYVVDVTPFGVPQTPGHSMHVNTPDHATRVLKSREHNRSVSQFVRAVSGPTL